jgi:hypothetical protein
MDRQDVLTSDDGCMCRCVVRDDVPAISEHPCTTYLQDIPVFSGSTFRSTLVGNIHPTALCMGRQTPLRTRPHRRDFLFRFPHPDTHLHRG